MFAHPSPWTLVDAAPVASPRHAIEQVAHDCGDLAVACVEAADAISGAAAGVARQVDMLAQLDGVIGGIETQQAALSRASGEARTLSDVAASTLERSTVLVDESIDELASLTDLVARMGAEVTQFASAMGQVRRAAESIGVITRTTRMLALNAAIEAERAGSSGHAFAVVAAEVKKLAQDTGLAAAGITTTIESLGREAEVIVGDIASGVLRAEAARRSFDTIRGAVADVRDYVERVQGQNAGVAMATRVIHDDVVQVRTAMASFADEARVGNAMLSEADGQVGLIEDLANSMFDTIVRSGLATDDQRFVDMAIAGAQEVAGIVERRIAAGEIAIGDVFDTDYRPIAGSDPLRYDTRFADFADRLLRPVIDRMAGCDPRITAVVCSDVNGYLPTHLTRYSAPPRADDPVWNDGHCRNRRRILDGPTARAIASTAPVMMAVFRFDRGGKRDFLRNAWVPLYIAGRRWGNIELAYLSAEQPPLTVG